MPDKKPRILSVRLGRREDITSLLEITEKILDSDYQSRCDNDDFYQIVFSLRTILMKGMFDKVILVIPEAYQVFEQIHNNLGQTGEASDVIELAGRFLTYTLIHGEDLTQAHQLYARASLGVRADELSDKYEMTFYDPEADVASDLISKGWQAFAPKIAEGKEIVAKDSSEAAAPQEPSRKATKLGKTKNDPTGERSSVLIIGENKMPRHDENKGARAKAGSDTERYNNTEGFGLLSNTQLATQHRPSNAIQDIPLVGSNSSNQGGNKKNKLPKKVKRNTAEAWVHDNATGQSFTEISKALALNAGMDSGPTVIREESAQDNRQQGVRSRTAQEWGVDNNIKEGDTKKIRETLDAAQVVNEQKKALGATSNDYFVQESATKDAASTNRDEEDDHYIDSDDEAQPNGCIGEIKQNVEEAKTFAKVTSRFVRKEFKRIVTPLIEGGKEKRSFKTQSHNKTLAEFAAELTLAGDTTSSGDRANLVMGDEDLDSSSDYEMVNDTEKQSMRPVIGSSSILTLNEDAIFTTRDSGLGRQPRTELIGATSNTQRRERISSYDGGTADL